MKNKKAFLGFVALAAVVILLLGVYTMAKPETTDGTKAITIQVIHKDASEKVFSYHTEAEYLGTLLLEEGLAAGEATQYGLTIHTVDGEIADWNIDQSYWAIFIGQEYATTGADGVVLTDGGEYRLVYTIG